MEFAGSLAYVLGYATPYAIVGLAVYGLYKLVMPKRKEK